MSLGPGWVYFDPHSRTESDFPSPHSVQSSTCSKVPAERRSGERPALWVVGSDLDFRAAVAYSIGRVAQLENTALGLHRGKRGPIEQSTHLAVAARGAVTAVDAGTLVVPWTGAPPRRQVLGRRKRRRRETDFRDDLLRRIDT